MTATLWNYQHEARILAEQDRLEAEYRHAGARGQKPVVKMIGGKIVARFDSVKDAATAEGITDGAISLAIARRSNCRGGRWMFAPTANLPAPAGKEGER